MEVVRERAGFEPVDSEVLRDSREERCPVQMTYNSGSGEQIALRHADLVSSLCDNDARPEVAETAQEA